MIGEECSTLGHLSLAEGTEFLAQRLERSYVADGIIMGIARGSTAAKKEQWNPQKMSMKNHPKILLKNVTKAGNDGVKKIQSAFVHLSKETQNWVIISGILLSVVLLYLIITSVIHSEYTLFVPQKYREMLAEARVNLDDATRMVDQPENF